MLARTFTALAGAALLAATPAAAQDASLSVNVADLNLATEAGRASLDRRIRHAADKVCTTGSVGLANHAAYHACRADALASAGQQVQQLAANRSGRIELARNTR